MLFNFNPANKQKVLVWVKSRTDDGTNGNTLAISEAFGDKNMEHKSTNTPFYEKQNYPLYRLQVKKLYV